VKDTTDQDTEDRDSVERARAEVIEAFERSAEVWGMNRSYGRLYGILYFADDPLSLDDLVAESGYAKSTVSTAMQKMDRLHFAHRRSVPGEGKKVFYEAERNFWRIAQQFLKHEVKREIDIMSRALESAATELEAADDERAQRDLEKIQSLQSIYDRSDRLVDMLTSSSVDRLTGLAERLLSSE
jgi:DNA-binding transcriptional regulator GbsR (MarR family)